MLLSLLVLRINFNSLLLPHPVQQHTQLLRTSAVLAVADQAVGEQCGQVQNAVVVQVEGDKLGAVLLEECLAGRRDVAFAIVSAG